MQEPELADPYITPRTVPARRPRNYLAIGIILGLFLLTVSAAGIMAWRSLRPARLMLDRGPAIYMDRGPVPKDPPPSHAPDAESPL